MQPERLAELIEKYAASEASPDEVKELTDWYRQKAYQDGVFPDNEEAVRLRMLAKLNQQIHPPKKKARYGRYAAAAVLLIAAGTYFLFRPSPPSVEVAAVPVVQPIQPGSNKAVLTLAGGKQIELNAANNGTLASQAGSVVSKSAEGNLVYAANEDTAAAVYNTLSTPKGGQYSITLPDGSRVWLNAASSLTYPTNFKNAERLVTLTGEAYFEIARNAAKPFKVDVAGRQQVLVLGTRFNIEAYPEDERINTTLLGGAVKLISGQQQVMLKPGEMVTNNLSGVLTKRQADEETVMAWKNGLFVFNDESLQSAMQKAARWYDVEVQYRDGVDKKRLGGVISRFKTITELLDKITKANGIHYEIKGRTVILMK